MMKKIEFTDEQKNALEAEGTVLVAAAAGSGKTAVLVERVVRRLIADKGLSADRVLIVTFTNSAAAELRAKISDSLKKKAIENPTSLHIKRQSILIEDASICTIDSFCINLVRENFSSLGISADFKIADEISFEQEKEDLLNELIYEKLSQKDPAFLKTISDLRDGYDESALKKIISSIYEKSCSMPYPEKWFEEIAEYNRSAAFDFDNSIVKEEHFAEILKEFNAVKIAVQHFLAVKSLEEDFESQNIDAINETVEYIENVSKFIDDKDWDGIRNIASDYTKSSWTTKTEDIEEATDMISTLNVKIGKVFVDDYATTVEILQSFMPIIENVLSLIVDYKNKINNHFREKNTFSFDMIEHMALELVNNNPAVLNAVNNRFDQIFVDEYQDNNDLQDELFYQLSKTKRNLFMVGDVKQSIYGFRNANPDNFLKKKNAFPLYEKDENPCKVVLTGNFRSRKGICEFNNFIFKSFMTVHDADMDYNEEEALVPLGKFNDNGDNSDVLLNLIEAEKDVSTFETEAEKIADYIIETMKREPFLHDEKEGLRKAKFSDFVLLMRSPKKVIHHYVKVFEKRNIPVNCPSEVFSEAIEIKIALSLLKTIDNPSDDISLLAVLKSPMFGFTDDEICEIRAINSKISIYNNLLNVKENIKVKNFLSFLSEARQLAAILPVDRLLLNLFSKTNFFDICIAMENGELKKANLYLLIEHAASYCTNKEKGISDFVYYIESDKKNNLSANVLSDSNAVRVMSFHSSKGLQFPICIISSLSKEFNLRDTFERCVCNTERGAAFSFYSEKYGSIIKPCTYRSISSSVKAKIYKEELRLLYVALTRAIEKLVLFVTVKDREKFLEKATENAINASVDGIPFVKGSLFEAKSFGLWILTALLCHRNGVALRRSDIDFPTINYDCSFDINFPLSEEAIKETDDAEDRETILDEGLNDDSSDSVEIPDFSHIFESEYPYLSLNKVPAKTSVSEILKKDKIKDYSFSSRPSFLSDKGLTPAEKGTANHKFMECCDFEKASKDIDSELERLTEWLYLTQAQAEVIDKKAISEFFKSDVYNLMKKSEKLLKEYRFITRINCSELNPEIPESLTEYTLVQGIADCIAVFNDEIILLDFKTDNSKDEEYYKKEYSAQLDLYARAVEKIFNLPVNKRIIYSFKLMKCIEI